MGARGRGAGRRAEAQRTLAETPPKKPAWERRNLSKSQRVCAFIESLPVTKGRLAGTLMRLLPDQRRFVDETYGERLIRIAVKSAPRGNGKTGLLAPIALCHLLGPEAEVRGEIYSAAIDRQQAGIMFNEMEAIILAVPEFMARVNIQRFHKRIEVLDGPGKGSTYEALSADARRAHGLAPSLWVYDELAQAKDRVLLDNLITAMGKRKRTLGVVISTQAAEDDHPLSQLIDDGLTGADPSLLVHLIAADPEADPFSVETLRAVNPALGVFLDEGDLVAEAERARRLPAFEPAYRNLRLNQRVDAQQDRRIVTASIWRAGAVSIERERLHGRRCYGGLDLSGKADLTALVLVFPDDEPELGYDVLPFFWTPLGAMEGRRQSERDLFKQWLKAEAMEGIPGPTIRFRFVAQRLAELAKEFDIRAVGYDRWRIDDFKAELDEIGSTIPLHEFGQGFKDQSPALDYLAELALTERLRHGGHPVLTANIASAVVVNDPAGNQKLDKERSSRRGAVRIDGAVALTMALGTARRFIEEPQVESVYEALARRRRAAALEAA